MAKPFTRIDLEKTIKTIFDIDEITPIINTQIGRYIRNNGYTYKDIAIALCYFFEVQNNERNYEKGIAIVPYVISDAKKWYAREAARKSQQLQQSQNYNENRIKYTIKCNKPISRRKIERQKINIQEIGDDDNGN